MSLTGRNDPHFISVIPKDLATFDATDVVRAFEYLQKEFHLSPKWHEQYRKELLKVERGVSDAEHFFRFARKHLDPPLKQITRRDDSIVFAMARYLIRHKINEQRREGGNVRPLYKGDRRQ